MPALPNTALPGHKRVKDRTEAALARLHEDRDTEFKQSTPYDKLEGTLVRSCLAMANLSGGGQIYIGVREGENAFEVVGISKADLDTYEQDQLAARINVHSSSPLRVQLLTHTTVAGEVVLVVDVAEAKTLPILCKADGKGVEKGKWYVRPFGEAATRTVQSAEEMQDVIIRVVESQARDLAAQARRVIPEGSAGTDRFDREIEGL